MRIHKTDMSVGPPHTLPGRVIAVEAQAHPYTVTVWYLVGDPEQYQVVGTGHEFPAGWQHVGTVRCGPLVWHVMRVAS